MCPVEVEKDPSRSLRNLVLQFEESQSFKAAAETGVRVVDVRVRLTAVDPPLHVDKLS